MLRVRRIVETALDCDDLRASAAFCSSLLDVTPMLDTDRLVAIDAGDATVLLPFQRGSTMEPVVLPAPGSWPSYQSTCN
ncbi:MAG TPA: hypothetical protein VFA59_20085 [Vicinamibacterales bacterium]|nr:hypothetical protein [Vicinamibacterales bacterium]